MNLSVKEFCKSVYNCRRYDQNQVYLFFLNTVYNIITLYVLMSALDRTSVWIVTEYRLLQKESACDQRRFQITFTLRIIDVQNSPIKIKTLQTWKRDKIKETLLNVRCIITLLYKMYLVELPCLIDVAHLISSDLISSDLIWSHLISPHLISSHLNWTAWNRRPLFAVNVWIVFSSVRFKLHWFDLSWTCHTKT